jgi:hypothetical protein
MATTSIMLSHGCPLLVCLEKAERVVQLMPTFAAFNHPFEPSETLEGNRKGEFDASSMKVLNDGLAGRGSHGVWHR